MPASPTRRLAAAALACAALSGCAGGRQPADQALVREPGQRRYGPPVAATTVAGPLAPYAVLSENSYHGAWKHKPAPAAALPAPVAPELPPPDPGAYARTCAPGQSGLLPLGGWRSWPDFPSDALRRQAVDLGLYVEVWERAEPAPTIAVVFKGMQSGSLRDWRTNLNWLTRFVPGFRDQYTLTSREVGLEFVEALARRAGRPGQPGPAHWRIVTTGHSLGGGLAQHFAYALPAASAGGVAVPRVSHAYAFDPSPVTGWSAIRDQANRARNAQALHVDRVFEHGEVLAYVRLLLGYLMPPSRTTPAVRQIRFNFFDTPDIIESHSMRQLACRLVQAASPSVGQAAGPWPPRP